MQASISYEVEKYSFKPYTIALYVFLALLLISRTMASESFLAGILTLLSSLFYLSVVFTDNLLKEQENHDYLRYGYSFTIVIRDPHPASNLLLSHEVK